MTRAHHLLRDALAEALKLFGFDATKEVEIGRLSGWVPRAAAAVVDESEEEDVGASPFGRRDNSVDLVIGGCVALDTTITDAFHRAPKAARERVGGVADWFANNKRARQYDSRYTFPANGLVICGVDAAGAWCREFAHFFRAYVKRRLLPGDLPGPVLLGDALPASECPPGEADPDDPFPPYAEPDSQTLLVRRFRYHIALAVRRGDTMCMDRLRLGPAVRAPGWIRPSPPRGRQPSSSSRVGA